MDCQIDFPDLDGGRWRMGFTHPHRVLMAHTLAEVTEVIALAEKAARDEHWVVGFVAYEAAPAFDPAFVTPPNNDGLPLAAFGIYTYDDALHYEKTDPAAFTCGPWTMATPRTTIEAGIETIRRAIADGSYYQVNYTSQLRSTFSGDAALLYAALREAQPDGYEAFIDGGEWQIASVSPELFFDWTPDRTLITRPMKGTAPRADENAAALRASAKDRAENLMIVDLLRNDLARVAETGSVETTSLFDIEALPTAWQMTSTVRCKTTGGTTLLDVFRALFPCGSVTGAPKIAAMRAIAELEPEPRGAYCGAIGVIRPNGHATFNVGIRTVTVDAKRGTARCGIGSGITLDSNAADEYAEWLVKRRFLLRATASFALVETLRLDAGRYWLLDGHLRRLQHSAEHFGFACDPDEVRQALDRNAAQHANGPWRVRLLLARDGNIGIETHALEANPKTVRIALASTPVDSGSESLRHKTTERGIYAAHGSARADVFDTLLYNERGEITEFTRGNVVVELDGKRVTPPVECGLLPGVLREKLLARGEIVEGVVLRSDLGRATRIWFMNSVRGELSVDMQSLRGTQ